VVKCTAARLVQQGQDKQVPSTDSRLHVTHHTHTRGSDCRVLVAIGTIIHKDKEATALARDMEVQTAAVKLSSHAVTKLADVAKDVMMVFEL
jgi:hypothetical protein